MTLKQLLEREIKSTGDSYRKIGQRIGVSHGTIGRIIEGDPPRNLSVLRKFATYFKVDVAEILGGATTRDKAADYIVHHPERHTAAEVIVAIYERLNREERDALKQCADALAAGEPDIAQHLIGQLKIIGETVRARQSKKPPGQRRPHQGSGA